MVKKRIGVSKVWSVASGKQLAVGIPKEIVKKLRLKQGDFVIWYEEDNRIYIVRGRIVEDGGETR